VKFSSILLAIGLVIITTGGALAWYVLTHGFSAREKPFAAQAFVARKLRILAIPDGSSRLRNPITPDALSVAEARDHFADHCAVCHANNGGGKTLINSGLYPPAPDLRADSTQGLSDGEIFYIIKNGIRFTGMPGWGGDDDENWKLVLFIRHLPHLSSKELALMREVNGMSDEGAVHQSDTSTAAAP